MNYSGILILISHIIRLEEHGVIDQRVAAFCDRVLRIVQSIFYSRTYAVYCQCIINIFVRSRISLFCCPAFEDHIFSHCSNTRIVKNNRISRVTCFIRCVCSIRLFYIDGCNFFRIIALPFHKLHEQTGMVIC